MKHNTTTLAPIILASQSPRRTQLLTQAEVPHTVVVMPIKEVYPTTLAIAKVPNYIALNKAKVVQQVYPNHIIIAADTIVVHNNTVIGKPLNKANAIEILTTLSAQVHTVITGVAILYQQKTIAFKSTTQVHFNALTKEQIKHYVNTYTPYDKAGAYAIQEWIGAIGIKKINGDYYNVMGLPIHKVVQALHKIIL